MRSVAIERRRQRGGPALVVRDDGEGVLPTLGREEALRFIATNTGASRKRNLSAEERRRLVITGQYGVGLLGFWSIGHRMEIRSRVGGSRVHVLRLVEDEPKVGIAEIAPEIGTPESYTEISRDAPAVRGAAPDPMLPFDLAPSARAGGRQDRLVPCTRPARRLLGCQGKEGQMAKQTGVRLVHFYDTEQHRVLCGAPAAEDHSTKHPRGITCGHCVALLRERAEVAASSGAGA